MYYVHINVNIFICIYTPHIYIYIYIPVATHECEYICTFFLQKPFHSAIRLPPRAVRAHEFDPHRKSHMNRRVCPPFERPVFLDENISPRVERQHCPLPCASHKCTNKKK